LIRDAENDKTPLFLLGATFSFIHFIDHCRESGLAFNLPKGSRVMDTGGIKKRSRDMSQEQFIRQTSDLFGIPMEMVGNMYGMTELSSQFYDESIRLHVLGEEVTASEALTSGENTQSQTDASALSALSHGGASSPSEAATGSSHGGTLPTGEYGLSKVPPHWVRTRIVHPETMHDVAIGERGIIVHYDLANLYSVVAMMTEDVGIRLENGFVLLGRAEGAEARGCSLAVEEFIRSTEGLRQ
jgi:acyl-CoA synthetase (AMP-forming)/AMP-acid ligase II